MTKSFQRHLPSSLVVLSLALVFCGFISNVVEGQHNNNATEVTADEKAVILKNAFTKLLKLKNVPGKVSHVPFSPSPPPQYMLELYDKYRRGDGNRKGNTVRSILAIKGNMNGDQMLLFNLSGINGQEELLQGELHYYKRRKVKWPDHASIPEYRMKFMGTHASSNKVTVTPLDTVPLPSRGRGWQVHDVTQILQSCRKSSAGSESNLLGIKFLGLNSHSKFVGLPLNKFLKMNSQPFLIVFTNDQEASSIETLESHMTEFVDSNNIGAAPNDSPRDSGRKNSDQDTTYPVKKQPDVENNDLSKLKHWYNQRPKEESSSRVARSVLDNELPENSISSNFIPQTSPNVLQARNRPKQNKVAIIPYPHMMTFGTQRKKGQKNRRRQNRRLPKMWQRQPDLHQQPRHENDATLDEAMSEEDVTFCRKRKLVVDFADIGWGEWIISPKSFEAHYCSGACSFPLMKNMKPSNHATIQSIVNAIGIHPNVPAPCCVADAMSSVTLLYFDEDRNVVLKNYPSMTVESCACR